MLRGNCGADSVLLADGFSNTCIRFYHSLGRCSESSPDSLGGRPRTASADTRSARGHTNCAHQHCFRSTVASVGTVIHSVGGTVSSSVWSATNVTVSWSLLMRTSMRSNSVGARSVALMGRCVSGISRLRRVARRWRSRWMRRGSYLNRAVRRNHRRRNALSQTRERRETVCGGCHPRRSASSS